VGAGDGAVRPRQQRFFNLQLQIGADTGHKKKPGISSHGHSEVVRGVSKAKENGLAEDLSLPE
jgi:hypothetical protein